MSAKLKLVENLSGVAEVALEIARERNKNVQRLCKAVKSEDYKTAKLLAEELDDEQGDSSHSSIN